ncbi:MAG: cytochrome c [Steroidobacteraceae bacterium]|nr:cytochrome c [Steroidobacteraceae bacterium]
MAKVFVALTFIVIAIGALSDGALADTAPAATEAGARRSAGTTAGIVQGRTLFNRNCQMCHNQRGVGGKCPTLVRGAWAPGGPNRASFMITTITDGRPGTEMPSWAKVLNPQQIRRIVAYLRHESHVIAAQDGKRARRRHYERRR